jgi:hypothetical protein
MSEARDQAAHVAAAVIGLAPLVLAPNIITGAWAGFCMGMVREVTEEGEVTLAAFKRALGSRLDLAFWTIGGAIVGAR